MCGIIGYVGTGNTVELLLAGLSRLEYRGYDSAGIALQNGQLPLLTERRAGKLTQLKQAVSDRGQKDPGWSKQAQVGIGHTRWATHGFPTDENAHPHTDCTGQIALVHNGIVENWAALKQELIATGHIFTSDTDTEVLAHLLEAERPEAPLEQSVRKVMSKVDGSLSLVVISGHEPGVVVGARRGSPLVIGKGKEENFLASDIPALTTLTKEVASLDNNQLVRISQDRIELSDLEGKPLQPCWREISHDLGKAEKEGYPTFMLKEIYEQPTAIAETLRGRVSPSGDITITELGISSEQLSAVNKVFIVGCGTSYHAGMVAKYGIERWTRLPTELDIASEFRYRDPVVDERTLVLGISQSGETADTLAAIEYARQQGAITVGVANVVESSLARATSGMLYTRAGMEIGVAATKTFTSSLAILQLFGLHLASVRNSLPTEKIADLTQSLSQLDESLTTMLETDQKIADLAERFVDKSRFFFLGRSSDMPIALEGALKLKEIAYVGAEGFPAGEMKHGPIALVEPEVVIFGIATDRHVQAKTLSNLSEMAARGATIVLLTTEDLPSTEYDVADHVMTVPSLTDPISSGLATVPLQLFSYHLAQRLGHDVDQPRNLAKTVTVE